MGSPVFVAIGKTDIASKPFFQKDLKVFPELKLDIYSLLITHYSLLSHAKINFCHRKFRSPLSNLTRSLQRG
jgi:hypothetical protein